jgi:ABC-type multidrug transport system ATPase subunit
VLELQEVSFIIRKDGEDVPLVDRVSIRVPKGHFMAIVGPSGCGKTTLLKTIAGLNPESAGALFWDSRNLSEDGDFSPSEIGYVPQFSIAYDPLTVDESVEAATRLRVRCRGTAELDQRIDRVLEETGLSPISDRQVKVLSGGQKRRLGLAMELVSDPKLLLCDEVTSGLDPRSEREIVRLLHDLSRKDGRIVLSVTHSLAHLELYDSILVLHEGRVAFHGPPEQLTHYFSVSDTEEVYPRLATQLSERWHDSWQKHRDSYQKMMQKNRALLVASGDFPTPAPTAAEEAEAPRPPGFFSQFATLLSRRWRIFFRDRGQVFLQLLEERFDALLFPALLHVEQFSGFSVEDDGYIALPLTDGLLVDEQFPQSVKARLRCVLLEDDLVIAAHRGVTDLEHGGHLGVGCQRGPGAYESHTKSNK